RNWRHLRSISCRSGNQSSRPGSGWRKSLLVAVSGVIVPFVLGFSYMKIRGDSTTEATFVGAAMVATSVGITARVLGDLGVLGSRSARIILGAAVFDDILG